MTHAVYEEKPCADPEGSSAGWVTAQMVADGVRRCSLGLKCDNCTGLGTRVDLSTRIEVEAGVSAELVGLHVTLGPKGTRTNVGPTLRRWVEVEP